MGIYFVVRNSIYHQSQMLRHMQQPSILESDVFPLSQLLGVALSQKLHSEITTNQQGIASYGASLVTQPSNRVHKRSFLPLYL